MARTYLVVIDDSPEARVALRFAARRASKTGGAVDVLKAVRRTGCDAVVALPGPELGPDTLRRLSWELRAAIGLARLPGAEQRSRDRC